MPGCHRGHGGCVPISCSLKEKRSLPPAFALGTARAIQGAPLWLSKGNCVSGGRELESVSWCPYHAPKLAVSFIGTGSYSVVQSGLEPSIFWSQLRSAVVAHVGHPTQPMENSVICIFTSFAVVGMKPRASQCTHVPRRSTWIPY